MPYRNAIGVWLSVIGLLLSAGGAALPQAQAAEPQDPCIQVGWEKVDAKCRFAYDGYVSISTSKDDPHTWVVTLQCANGGICTEYFPCVENGEEGLFHDVFMDGVDVGDVCVPDKHIAGPSREKILEKFKELTWPGSELTVQPPGGETLVNLETIFSTTNTEPTTQVVTMVKKKVTIVAEPVSYTWTFGDGSILTTASAGKKFTAGDELDDDYVLHVYSTTDDVKARVTTTYSGTFKIGSGDWQDLEATHTVAGPEVVLEVLEAKPQLVLE